MKMANAVGIMTVATAGALACASASAAPLIQMDFNDVNGDPSLDNRGTLDLTGKFMHGPNNENTTGADYAAVAPASNSGGYSVQMKTTSNNRGKVSLGDVTALDGGLSALTLTAWVNLDAITHTNEHVIFANAEGNNGWSLAYLPGEETIRFREGDTNRDWDVSLTRGQWTFIAVTFDGSIAEGGERLELFTGDGQDLTSHGTDFAGTMLLGNGTEVATIGNGPATSQKLFQGYIDNLRIYDTNESANLEAIMQANDVIPEPSTLSLAAIGLGLIISRRR